MLEDRNKHQFDLMDAIQEGICFLTNDHKILFTNTQVSQLLGLPSGEILGRDFFSLFPEGERSKVEKGFEQAMTGVPARLNTKIRSPKSNRDTPILLRLVRYTDTDSTEVGIYSLMMDLTELVQALREQEKLAQRNRALEEMVVTCPLTGIYNRRYFELRYEEELHRARRYAHGLGVAMVDVDKFKEVNDTQGHQAGDEILKRVARSLRDTVRNTDIVARYGGDEFVLVFPEMKKEGILPLAIRLRQRIQNENSSTSPEIPPVTVSIGLSCLPPGDTSTTAEELLKQADEALYKAKEAGRNRIVLFGHPIE